MPELRDPGPIAYDAELHASDASGAACFVDFLHDLRTLYGKGNLVPVRVTWDGTVTYRGSLAKMGGPCAMVLCRKDVLAQLGKRAGDRVHLRVELDTEPRTVEVPPLLAEALGADAALGAAWEALAPSCKREYATWIAEAKQEATAQRRIEKALPMIREGRRLK